MNKWKRFSDKLPIKDKWLKLKRFEDQSSEMESIGKFITARVFYFKPVERVLIEIKGVRSYTDSYILWQYIPDNELMAYL